MTTESHVPLLSALCTACVTCCAWLVLSVSSIAAAPNVILIMADDMGWGQTGYYNHPVLQTPHLDAMAANGLRFDRFYAGAPNCSPTRATVMTGRTNDRTGVLDHGFPLRLQERTIAQAFRDAGYATGHFGKWHLSGFSGPGAPILKDDERNPGVFGFETWLSVTNFFDRNPILSRNGKFEEFQGDSSEIVVNQAVEFIQTQVMAKRPFFTVIWYGSPHSPFVASEDDIAQFGELDRASQQHYGELVAMDRSLGKLRESLRTLSIEGDTLLWFCSDNGGLNNIVPETVGGLRGFKGTVYEGGLRVPAVAEWPGVIQAARVTEFPCGTVDLFPTLAAVAGLNESTARLPQDGMSLRELFDADLAERARPLGVRHKGRGAWIDNDYKLVCPKLTEDVYELYNLAEDPQESRDLAFEQEAVLARMKAGFEAWNASVERSLSGADYPEGQVTDRITQRRSWPELDIYRPWFDQWRERPEFRNYLK